MTMTYDPMRCARDNNVVPLGHWTMPEWSSDRTWNGWFPTYIVFLLISHAQRTEHAGSTTVDGTVY
jgi:hypothetical protein